MGAEGVAGRRPEVHDRILPRQLTALPLWLAAAVALAAPLLRPVYNPDVWWHLSAGRRIVALRAIPRADWLSDAAPAWRDFEWLTELCYYGAWRAAGPAGLWLLKAALLCALIALAWRLLRALEVGGPAQPAALALFGWGLLPWGDLRADLSSAVGVAWLLLRLESFRRARGPLPRPWTVFAAFALWSNLHAGYPVGLALLALYAACAPAAARRAHVLLIGAAALGCCLQPGGPALEVFARHARSMALLSAQVNEWRPAVFADPWSAGLYALAAAAVAGVAFPADGAGPGLPLSLAALGACALAWRHLRLGVFVPSLAAPCAAAGLAPALALLRRPAALLLAGLVALPAAGRSFSLAVERGALRRLAEPVPVAGAADFLASQAALRGRVIMTPQFEWSGYLGWRLAPDYEVWADGRYVFFDRVALMDAAAFDKAAWEAFVDGSSAGVVVLLRSAPPLPLRPARWALVHEDADALVVVRRAAVPAAWLRAREIRSP